MLTSADVKRILDENVQRGETLHISKIQKLIEDNFELTEEDWNIYTDTRPTTYPKWKHLLQSVLAQMKAANRVNHNEEEHTYTF